MLLFTLNLRLRDKNDILINVKCEASNTTGGVAG